MGLRRGRISKPDSAQFLVSLNDLNVRLSEPASYDNVFSLAQEHGLTVYDAAYLDLAIQEGLPLASLDGSLFEQLKKSASTFSSPELRSI